MWSRYRDQSPNPVSKLGREGAFPSLKAMEWAQAFNKEGKVNLSGAHLGSFTMLKYAKFASLERLWSTRPLIMVFQVTVLGLWVWLKMTQAYESCNERERERGVWWEMGGDGWTRWWSIGHGFVGGLWGLSIWAPAEGRWCGWGFLWWGWGELLHHGDQEHDGHWWGMFFLLNWISVVPSPYAWSSEFESWEKKSCATHFK